MRINKHPKEKEGCVIENHVGNPTAQRETYANIIDIDGRSRREPGATDNRGTTREEEVHPKKRFTKSMFNSLI